MQAWRLFLGLSDNSWNTWFEVGSSRAITTNPTYFLLGWFEHPTNLPKCIRENIHMSEKYRSFLLTMNRRVRERWKGKDQYATAFLTAWGAKTWILPFSSFSAGLHPGSLWRENAWFWVKREDLLGEVSLQWNIAEGASGWPSTKGRKNDVMKLNEVLGSRAIYKCQFMWYSEIMSYSISPILWGNNICSKMGMGVCKVHILSPNRVK